jgi:pimeloyl-ACP methyl ester carboxylesterase
MKKTFLYQASTIHYQTFGSGKPILLLHGFGEDSTIWQHQIQALQNDYYLIVPDLPGTAHSQPIQNMSMEGMADCMKELLKYETPKFPLQGAEGVFGHSMGGYITLALIEKYPQLFKSFGLIHSSAFADNPEKVIARKKSIEFIQQNGAYEFLKTTTPNLFYNKQHTHINTLVEQGKNFTPKALAAYYNAMIDRPDRTIVLKLFTKPILFVIGEHDQAVPFAQSLQQCHLPQQSHVHILRNTAHMGMLEESEKINEVIKAFLKNS